MNLQRTILATFVAATFSLSLTAAEIEIPSLTPLGKDLTAKVATEPGERVAWLADAGSTVIKCGDGRAHVWATPGTHEIKAIVVPVGDADPIILSATYSVGDAPPTPPVVVKTLAELAGDKAAILVEIVADGRGGLDQFQTVAQLQKYFTVAYDMVNIPQTHPAAIEIKKRIDSAGSGSLADAKVRQSIEAALAKIASDLGQVPPGPTPPPITEGKRLVVVLHEVDDQSSAFANLKVSTANNSAAAKYFRDKGHTVQFLEEEQKGADGQPYPLVEQLKALNVGVPAIFVLDPATKAVIYKQKLEPGVTADNLVEYTKRGGG